MNNSIINNFAQKINEKEKKSNKVTALSSSVTDSQYPSAKAVYDAINDNGFITSSQIINNDNLCDYKTLIPLINENGSVSNVSFEDYDFDIMFIINPNGNDCNGSMEIGEPALNFISIEYSNQGIQIKTPNGDEWNIPLNMDSENIIKIKQEQSNNYLTFKVNNYDEVISVVDSEIPKNVLYITSTVGTISNFGVKTCTQIITEATIDELIKYGEERL